jgi:hypothetical protein
MTWQHVTPGTYRVTAVATDDAGLTTTSPAAGVTVVAPVTMNTASIPQATIGAPYAVTLAASGGTGAYSWSVVAGGLPGGVSLAASSGVITGTPSLPGTFSFTVRAQDASDAANAATRSYTLSIASATKMPAPVPGTIQAEDFDDGGEGVGYHDTTIGNHGGAYRATHVDLEATTDTGGGYNVGWITAGEWLKYTVTVATAGTYTLTVRVASSGAGGNFHIEFAGMDKTGTMSVPNTGGWQAWVSLQKTVTLAAGTQSMRLVIDGTSANGVFGNVNYVALGTAPIALPGIVQAEDFDNTGDMIGYRDSTIGNKGGAFRATNVDIEATTDAGGGYNVGWMVAGEWLKYTVTVAKAGTYTLTVRVACGGAGGTFHVEFGGTDKTGSMTVPNTGGWQKWVTLRKTVTLAAGTQTMRLVLDAHSPVGIFGNVNYMSLAMP